MGGWGQDVMNRRGLSRCAQPQRQQERKGKGGLKAGDWMRGELRKPLYIPVTTLSNGAKEQYHLWLPHVLTSK